MSTPQSSDRSRRRLAWTAPFVVAGVVAAGVALSSTDASGASPDLPARTAAQLIADVQTSSTTAFSGEVSETADLGIPTLPGVPDTASLSWQTFLSGTHKARVWVDGAAKQRVALIGELSEADVVHNGTDVWTYTSQTNTVTHNTLPAHGTHRRTPDATDTTPSAVAADLLTSVTPTTRVTVDATERVAGRDAYTLVLTPRDARSTVDRVTIAIDAARHVPLRVQVFGSGSAPAFSTGFTSIDFSTPAASTFAFKTPAGATVSKDPLGVTRSGGYRHHGDRTHTPSTPPASSTAGSAAKPEVIGTGWTSVLALPKGSLSSALRGSSLDQLTSPVGTDGARLLHTSLVNALILSDGRVFVGAVSPALLQRVAATH